MIKHANIAHTMQTCLKYCTENAKIENMHTNTQHAKQTKTTCTNCTRIAHMFQNAKIANMLKLAKK